jgi:IS1 family transposase
MCKDCQRQFVEHPESRRISDETKALIDKLLLERIPLAGIARVTGVSERWLQTYVNEKYAEQPRQVQVRSKKKGCLTIECDELWSFVGNKDTKQWVWLALDRDTGEIVGCAMGKRDEATAREVWESLPPVYRQCAVCYRDFWEAYACVLPSKRHRPVGKALSFSKKVENHIGAIWYFIHHYHASLA